MAKSKKVKSYDKDAAVEGVNPKPLQPKKELPKGDIQKHPKFDKFKKGAH